MWTYRCYDDGGSLNLWQRWYDATTTAQGSHSSVFDNLEGRDVWKKPYSDILDKKNKIIEIRLTDAAKIEWRVLGFYGTARREFIVVAICNHKQKVYDPADVKKTAVKRKKEIEANPKKALACVRPT
ncbi:hypothetical protein [Nitrobacter winogradskyi]|uniref:Uncharacterized protein n=2 Tax=Nitrobacter winogradskyi TaxID=913 RepID=A0ACC6AI31_NITWI|nr:hypothetical protein [Nitrobacter winogradskyi]MCP1999158.1 hypothetical protein [Nitrobacter winogradskyi]GEC14649.1 hypothetical protein NWI01_05410 [Nitrobacter winogradskyi]